MQTPVLQRIPGPAGLIETAAMGCALSEPMPSKALLLLHPHPLHGGTMANKVVTTLARADTRFTGHAIHLHSQRFPRDRGTAQNAIKSKGQPWR